MIDMISPIIRKFAFSNLLKQTKELALPFVELPSADQQEQKERNSAETLFSLFTADIIKKEVIFIR